MLRVYWKVGPKPKGNWLTPVRFSIAFKRSPETELNVFLNLQKSYKLPESIICFKSKDTQKCGEEKYACRKIEEVNINFREYIVPHEIQLSSFSCGKYCPDCRMHLPWRPGHPDYSDYMAVFQKITHDLQEAWNRAVEEAAASEELDLDPVTIPPGTENEEEE